MRKIITIFLCFLFSLLTACGSTNGAVSSGASASSDTAISSVPSSGEEELGIELTYGLTITKIGGYTGAFVEDGTDEVVENVLMLVVENNGDEYIQYAEITMGQALFSLSTLMPGESVVVLEQDRMAYNSNAEYALPEAQNVARFTEEPTLCTDKLYIQTLDGCLNITNVSGADITGDVVIYYKNYVDGLYYGGITYRVRLSGGIASEEIKQIMVNHYKSDASKIVFVTVGE